MIPEIPHLPMNPALAGQAALLQHVRYSENGQELTLILPWFIRNKTAGRAPIPLILFVQGSGWTTPNLDFEIPMLSHFAEEGIAVATVCHRSILDGHPVPAFLQDVKCAVRFLRAHAGEYGIDKERIAAFGTSSGGNTVCLLGLTGDDPALRTGEYPEESDAVCGVVSCFGPTDLKALFAARSSEETKKWLTAALGPDESRWEEQMRLYSPVERVRDGEKYPPFLLLNGTGDNVVPHQQMEALYTRLKEAGADVNAYYVDGAEHEGNFWSPEVRRVIHDRLIQFVS